MRPCLLCPAQPIQTSAVWLVRARMLHSAAPSSFNMFPFGPPAHSHAHGHGGQHGAGSQPAHHGPDMFHPAPGPAHHHAHAQQHSQQPEVPQKPRFLFKMPRVVPNQKEKFETDEFMKRHSREGEVSVVLLQKAPRHRV